MSTENEIAIAQHAQNNIVIAGDHNTVHQFIQYVKKELSRYPYKFLSTYEIADRDIFFGRNAVIEELSGTIPRHKVLLISGASGAGKSSLINAGIIPRLTEQGYRFLTIRDYTDPLQQLRAEFIRKQWLAEVETGSLTQMLWTLHQRSVTLLVFDQFERFFLHVPYATRQTFLREFKECLSDLSVIEMNVVFAIRRDFLGQMLAEFEQVMPTHFSQESKRLDLYPLSKAEAREAIMNPLKNLTVKIGYDQTFVDEVLLTRLLEQTSDQVGIEPPHLQIVCNQLYEAAYRRLSTEVDMVQINVSLYDELGGVEKILQTYLDEVVKEITADQPAKIAVVRSLLKAMIETSGTRCFISIVDLQRALPDVGEVDIDLFLGQLQDRRVLETQQREGEWLFSLSHEIMVPQVASWYDEREWERKKAAETLERGLKEWASSKTLLNEKQFSHIRQWLPQWNEVAEALLVKSEAAVAEQKRKEKRQSRLRQSLVLLVFMAAIVAVLFAYQANENEKIATEQKSIAQQQRNEANQQQMNAELQASALTAEKLLNSGNKLDALIEVIRAGKQLQQANYKVKPDIRNQVILALQQAVYEVRERNRLDGHKDKVNSISFSPDGETIATASEDGTAKLWSRNGKLIRTLREQNYGIESIKFSPNGKVIAVAFSDIVELYNSEGMLIDILGSKKKVFSSIQTEFIVGKLVFSSDSLEIATPLSDGKVRIWGIDGTLHNEWQAHSSANSFSNNEVSSIDFSPDNTMIVTSSVSEVKLWKHNGVLLKTFEPKIPFKGWGAIVNVKFNQNGQELTVIKTNSVTTWNIEGKLIDIFLDGKSLNIHENTQQKDNQKDNQKDKELLKPTLDMNIEDMSSHLREKTITVNYINEASFSIDGETIAVGSNNAVIRLFSREGESLQIFEGHNNGISAIGFSPNNKDLVSGSIDGTVKIWGLNNWESKILKGHTRPVRSVNFSSDNQFIISTGRDNTIKLWNHNGELIKTLDISLKTISGNERVPSISFSPDSQFMALLSQDNTIKLFHKKGTLIKVLESPTNKFWTEREVPKFKSIRFSPDAKIIAAGFYQTVLLWDIEGRILETPTTGFADVYSMDFSPDSQLLAIPYIPPPAKEVVTPEEIKPTDYEFSIALLKRDKASSPIILKGHNSVIMGIKFSPSGELVASVSLDKTLKLWDRNGNLLKNFDQYKGEIFDVDFSPDGQSIVTAGAEDGLLIWNVSGQLLARFGGVETFGGIGISSEVNQEKTALVITKVSNDSPAFMASLREGDQILAIDGKPTKDMSEEESLKLIKGKEGTNVTLSILDKDRNYSDITITRAKIELPIGYTSVSFSPDGQLIVSGGNDGILKFWTPDGKGIKILKGHNTVVSAISFSPNGQIIASASWDGTAKLWNNEGKELTVFKKHRAEIWSIDFSPDGKTIASASDDGTVRLWNLKGEELKILDVRSYLQLLTDEANSLSAQQGFPTRYGLNNAKFSPTDNLVASVDEEGIVRFWNHEGILVKTLPERTYSEKPDISEMGAPIYRYFDIDFNPDGQLVAVTETDNTVKLYRVVDGVLLKTLQGHNAPVNCVKFSSDGQTIATGSNDNTVRLWDLEGNNSKVFVGHNDAVWKIAFSPDDQMIVSASRDGTVKFWSRDGKELENLQKDSFVYDVSFSPNGKTLAMANQDRTVSLLNFDLDDLIARGCVWINDYLRNNEKITQEDSHLCDSVNPSSSLLIELGRNLAKIGDIDGATIKFQEALKQDSNLSFIPEMQVKRFEMATQLFLKAFRSARKGESDDIVSNFVESLQLDSDFSFGGRKKIPYLIAEALKNKGDSLAKVGDTQGAIEKFRIALSLNPNLNFHPRQEVEGIAFDLLVQQGKNLAQQGKVDEAIATYLKARQPDLKFFAEMRLEEILDALSQRGLQLLAQHSIQEAIAISEKLSTIKQDHGGTWFLKGSILIEQDKLVEAVEAFRKVGSGQDYLNAQANIAILLVKQGHLDKAIEHLRNASVSGDEDKLKLKLFEAQLLTEHKRYDEAMIACNDALSLNQDGLDALFLRAGLAEKMGNVEKFEQDLRHVLKIEPANVNVLNSLGYTLADRTNRYQEAHNLLKQALELEPENPFVLDSMGWVLYKMGKSPESLEYLRKAYAKIDASVSPESVAETASHLGEVLWASGEKEEAKTVWKKALKDFPDNQSLREVVKRFWSDFERE